MNLRTPGKIKPPRRNHVAHPEQTQIRPGPFKFGKRPAEKILPHGVIGIRKKHIFADGSLKAAVTRPGRPLRLDVVNDNCLDIETRRCRFKRPD